MNETIQKGFGNFLGSIIGSLTRVTAPIFTNLIKSALSPAFIESIVRMIPDLLNAVFDAIVPVVIRMLDSLLDILSPLIEGMLDMLVPLLETVGPLTEAIIYLLQPLLKRLAPAFDVLNKSDWLEPISDHLFKRLGSILGPSQSGMASPTDGHVVIDSELVRVERLQSFIHYIYAKYEPTLLRIIDRLLNIDFLTKGEGLPILKFLAKPTSILPTGETVSTDRAKEFIDIISKVDGMEIAVGPCPCQTALHKRKGPLYKEISVLYGSYAYKKAVSDFKDISPEEAKKLLDTLHNEGCVPTFYSCMRSQGWLFVICSCENEICVPTRSYLITQDLSLVHPGPDIIAFDEEKCVKCGNCVERCIYGANSFEDEKIKIDYEKCHGCGLCVSTCTGGARRLVEREDYESRYYPIHLVEKYRT